VDPSTASGGEPETLVALWHQRRPADPSAVLVDVPGGERLTYADADRGSARIANALVALGVRPGDRVGLQIEKSPQALLVYLACIRSGAVLLAMNPAYTEAETDYLVADACPAVVIGDPARAAPSGPVVLTADESGSGTLAAAAAEQPDHFDDVEREPGDLAAILYTSGTTGRPKGAMLTHRNLASNALALHRAWGFVPDDVLLHALPMYHAHGLFVATNCVLANGTGMVFLPRFSVDAVIEHLVHCTVFMGVPTYYTRLLSDPRFDSSRCRQARLFISGSAPLPASVHDEFRRRTGHAILERYGLTETLMNTSNPLDGERRPGTVGFALPGVTVRVAQPPVDETVPAAPAVGAADSAGVEAVAEPGVGAVADSAGVAAAAEPGVGAVDSVRVEAATEPDRSARDRLGGQGMAGVIVGEIEVRGPNVFSGYWGRPELAVGEFTADGFFRTGDLGAFDADGYLRIVGRSKDLIISGGLNVYPKEVEDVLDAMDGIAESAVVGMPDPDFGEVVVAVVVALPGRTVDEAAVRAQARGQLAAFKVPKRITITAALPRNAMGKVEKAKLRNELKAEQ
jgi:malonyl-CoA/methylmalonyl-CoA synthetase